MAKSDTQLVQMSGYLFLLGVIIAIIAGLAPGAIPSSTTATVLMVLGAIIGLLAMGGWADLTSNEEQVFLLATIALIAAGSSGAVLSAIPVVGSYLRDIIGNIAALVAPAAVLIALTVAWRVGAGKLRLGR